MKLFKKFMVTFAAVLAVLGFNQSASANVNGTPKELTSVISDVLIWDTNNGREAIKRGDSYVLIKDLNYSFETSFDLSAYNANLSNGDHFSFNIPTPFTINSATLPLTDPETGIEIGDVVITSNGDNAGGRATITLKNLDQYLTAKNGTVVENVKGKFFVIFSVKTAQNATPANFADVTGGKTFNVTVEERKATDNSEVVGRENLAKYGGVLNEANWDSQILNKQGNYWHKWRVRLNASGKTFDQLTLHDKVADFGGPMQFLPDPKFFTVTAGDGIDQGWQLTNPVVLTPGVDYTVTYNASYTAFDLVIHNPGNRRFMVDYSTSAPADGSTIANIVSVTANGQALPISDIHTTTEITVERLSKIQTGASISIDTAGRLTIYKVDEQTRQPLGGAIFKLTKPNGEVMMLPATDPTTGRTQSEFITDQEINAGQFKLEEVTAPSGYHLDTTVRDLTLSTKGTVRTITNKKATTGSVLINYIRESDGKVIKAQVAEKTDEPAGTAYDAEDDRDATIVFAEDGKTYEFVRTATDLTDPSVVANATITRVDPATGQVEAGITKVITHIYKERVTAVPNRPVTPNNPNPGNGTNNNTGNNNNTVAPGGTSRVDAIINGGNDANLNINANNGNANANNGVTNRDNNNTPNRGGQARRTLPATGDSTNTLAVLGLVALLALIVFSKQTKKQA